MPHKKHPPKAATAAPLDFELPPTQLAKRANLSRTQLRKLKRQKRRRDDDDEEDDTPAAFRRLMKSSGGGGGAKYLRRGGVEDTGERGGGSAAKRRRRGEGGGEDSAGSGNQKQSRATGSATAPPPLQIQPGESLSSFNARVDKTMTQGVRFRAGGDTPKKNKKKKKNKRNKDVAADGADDDDELDSDDPEPETAALIPWDKHGNVSSDGKSRKRNRARAASPDPFACLLQARPTFRFGDAQVPEPPKFGAAVPRELLRDKTKSKSRSGEVEDEEDAAVGMRSVRTQEDVPRKAGSLARREALGVERKGVVEKYREMMRGRGVRRI